MQTYTPRIYKSRELNYFTPYFLSARKASASRYLKFTIDIDTNGVAMEDAQRSIRCNTFPILKREAYQGRSTFSI